MYAPHLPSTQETTNFSSLTLVSNDPANSNPLSIPEISITFNGSGLEPVIISPNNMQYFSYLGNSKFNLVVDDSDLDETQQGYAIGGTDFSVVLPSSSTNTGITPFFDTERLGIIAQDIIFSTSTKNVLASMKNWIRVDPGSDYSIDYYPTSADINGEFLRPAQTRYISRIVRTSLPCDTILVHIKLLEAEWSGFEVYFRSNADGSIDNANWRMLWVDTFPQDGTGDDTTPGPGDWDGGDFPGAPHYPGGAVENSYIMAPAIDDLNPPIGDFTQYQIKINFIGETNPNTCIKQLTAMPAIKSD